MRDPPNRDGSTKETDLIELLLVECLDALTARGPEAVEAVLARHPGRAAAVRERLGLLDGLGMLAVDETASHDAAPGLRQLGDYRILEQLGAGGMGVVYLAEQVGLDRRVALKVLPHSALCSETEIERFRREARAIARLDHPNIVRVLAAGEQHGVCWIAMEHVPGRGLDELLREAAAAGKPLRVPDVLAWGRDLARALAASHARGIVHRDVKPGNVQITPDGSAKLLDFGLARMVDDARLTRSRGFLGSPCYASPEQVRAGDQPIGPATDVYGLGVTLYECLSGAVPFAGDTTEQVFHSILASDAKPLSKLAPNVPRDAELVVLKAIEKEPAQRYASAADLADDLDAVLDLRPIRAQPASFAMRARKWVRRHRALAAAAAVAALALLTLPLALAIQAHRRTAERLTEARSALREADSRIDELRAILPEIESNLDRITEVAHAIHRRAITGSWDEAFVELHERRTDVQDALLRRSEVEYRIRESIERALRLGADSERARQLDAEMYLELYRFAERIHEGRHYELDWMLEDVQGRLYRELTEEKDREGRFTHELHPTGVLAIDTEPPGADVYLFEYLRHADVVDDGDMRQVPVPYGGTEGMAVQPGTIGLRVVEATGELHENDFVFELAGYPVGATVLVASGSGDVRRLDRLVSIDGQPVHDTFTAHHLLADAGPEVREHTFVFERASDRYRVAAESLASLGIALASPRAIAETGGVAARVWQHGHAHEVVLQAGATYRPTATPLLVRDECRVGVTPFRGEFEEKPYLVLLRRPGHRDLRWFVSSLGAQALRLVPTGHGPRDFVFVQTYDHRGGTPFWIMDREVTSAEYLRFLNDPATLAAIDASAEKPIRFPRTPDTLTSGGLWKRTERGFELPADWDPQWPAVGVSWEDARAYAAWRSELAKADGSPFRFTLPTEEHWTRATVSPWTYPWGNLFRPTWTNSCFSRPLPRLEPVYSYPIDESPLGLLDTAGSAFEWIDKWFSTDRGERLRLGGAWEYAAAQDFSPGAWSGARPDFAAQSQGFRLVAREGR